MKMDFLTSVYVFMLAAFIGFEANDSDAFDRHGVRPSC